MAEHSVPLGTTVVRVTGVRSGDPMVDVVMIAWNPHREFQLPAALFAAEGQNLGELIGQRFLCTVDPDALAWTDDPADLGVADVRSAPSIPPDWLDRAGEATR